MLFSISNQVETLPLVCKLPQEGGDARAFPVGLSCCDNPLCRCSSMTLDLYEEPLSDKQRHRITLDVVTRCEKERAESDVSAICRQMYDNMTDEDWELLEKIYLSRKTAITQRADLDDLSPDFPVQEIEESSSLIFYNEILPFQPATIVDYRDSRLQVLDMYCVKRSCHCYQVHLLIEAVDEVSGGVQEVDRPLYVIVYLGSGQYRVDDQGTLGIKPEVVMPLVFKSVGLKLYKQRYQQMRQWYNACQERLGSKAGGPLDIEAALPPTLTVKAGRNDPCPCGSGKKYKKCCLM